MYALKLPGAAALSFALLVGSASAGLVQAQTGPQTIVIGVDHSDPANQRPDQNRVFEYTDFFSRDVSVHTGDTIDFRWAPGAFHVIMIAPTEQAARAVYPTALIDATDKPAKATGLPKIQLGPGSAPIMGGSISGGGQVGNFNDTSFCGLTKQGQKPCTFSGGGDVESSGGVASFDPQSGAPAPVDWMMQINAPVGDYDYFCSIHPGMSGKLHVVGSSAAASTQADIDARGQQQFLAEQALALQAEQQYNVDRPTTEPNGSVTHHVTVGINTPDNRVAIDEMLPHTIHVAQGEQVEFKWRDTHNVHTVGIAQAESQLPEPFAFDCGTSVLTPPNPMGPPGGGICVEPGEAQPEIIGDPGTALSGTVLTNVQQIADSGFLIGSDFGVQPTTQTWSVRTDNKTANGTYQYWCSVHDFMNGQVVIGQ